MNSENLILRETDNLPLINKNDFIENADFDSNFINIFNDFLALCDTNSVDAYSSSTTYTLGNYVVYNNKLWESVSTDAFANVTPGTDTDYWVDRFPTILGHIQNSDTILAENTVNEVTASEIRAFIDAGLTSTTNLSISENTGVSLKINSSTGTDVTLTIASETIAGLLSATDKIKLNNLSGVNTGDQTLESLGAEAVSNKATDFSVLNDVLYPTTEAVSEYLTTGVASAVESFIGDAYEVIENKAINFSVVNDTLYPTVKAVDDQLDLKVDKVAGERLITSAEATILSNTSGTNTGDQTFLNARVQSVTSSATVTPTNLNDLVKITAQAVGLTLANPTGAFAEGQALIIRIKDNGTARSIGFDTNYRAIGVTLPTTTVISKTIYLGIIYNSTDSKWDVIGYNIEA